MIIKETAFMKMKKFINAPETITDEELTGLLNEIGRASCRERV